MCVGLDIIEIHDGLLDIMELDIIEFDATLLLNTFELNMTLSLYGCA